MVHLPRAPEITTDPQTGFYLIPGTAMQTFTDAGGGEVMVDNRGVWNVGIYSAADGSFREARTASLFMIQRKLLLTALHKSRVARTPIRR